GRPTLAFHSRLEALQRVIRERAWATPGPRDAAPPTSAPLTAVTAQLAGAALVGVRGRRGRFARAGGH
ncbi:hypothetical protein, partial [Micromonospora parastrephiae]|uniref:hypothetical protein n=1 Tax=Micromonospora parastrephiae TaxID=2806101 RepID=UPI001EE4C57B